MLALPPVFPGLLGRPMLAFTVHWQALRSILPSASAFHSHCRDRMENGWLLINHGVGRLFAAFRWIQSGNIRHYGVPAARAQKFTLSDRLNETLE